MILKCLIVDDEPIARQILEKYISEVPNLVLSGTCKNAFEAMDFLQKNKVDIVFLDINMPKLSGLNLLRTMNVTPDVIITSAYSEYAIEGFELSVIDYLLKPISFERFLQATMKVKPVASQGPPPPQKETAAVDFLFVKNEKKLVKISFNEINYIEAYGNYIKIYTDQMLLVPQTLSEFSKKLPSHYMRIHKSYIINFNQVKLIEGNQMLLKGSTKLPIGKSFKKDVLDRINGKT